MPGFDHPDTAMQFRDLITGVTRNIVEGLRPGAQTGTVINVARGGPVLPVSPEGTIPVGTEPPPESPGNPRQLYYASVRLDNGETVSARIHDVIPVCREAEIFDPENPVAQTPYLIDETGIYRERITVSRVDDNGAGFISHEPNLNSHVDGPPYVPPRVVVEGSAGKYVITSVLRGMAEFENPVLDRPFQIGAQSAAIIDDPLRPGYSNLRVYSGEAVYSTQGWVGNSSWDAASGFEVILTFGSVYQTYTIHRDQIDTADREKWMLVPPTYETYSDRNNGFPSDQKTNVLLAHLSADGATMNFYVCNRDMTAFSVAPDLYLNGMVILRTIQGPLQRGITSMPPIDLATQNQHTWGLTRTSPIVLNQVHWARPTPLSSRIEADLQALKNNLCGGGVLKTTVGTDGTHYLKWSQPFKCFTARSIWRPSGHNDIDMPPVGFQIPVVGWREGDSIARSRLTVTADGIPFPGTIALYYQLTIGEAANTQLENFIMVDPGGSFDIPDHWILIASHQTETTGNIGNAAFRTGAGTEIDVWRAMANPVGELDPHPDNLPFYRKENGIVTFKGAYKVDNAISAPITYNVNIPPGYRPGNYWIGLGTYISGSSAVAGRVDITFDGQLWVRRDMAAGDLLYLNPIQYIAEL